MQSPEIYWSRVAREKAFTHPLRTDWLSPLVSEDRAVLDLGCGYGRLTAELARGGWRRALGADTAAGMIERAREEHPSLDFRHLPVGPLPFEDASFGAVLLFAVLTCVPDNEDQESLIAECERILAPGGVLYVSDLLLQSDERNRARYAKEESPERQGTFELPEGVRLRHFTRTRLESLFAAFDELRFEPFEVVTMNGHRADAFQYIGRRAE